MPAFQEKRGVWRLCGGVGTAGRLVQHPHCSTSKLCFCNGAACALVLFYFKVFFEIKNVLMVACVALKAFSTEVPISDMQAAHSIDTDARPYHHRCRPFS